MLPPRKRLRWVARFHMRLSAGQRWSAQLFEAVGFHAHAIAITRSMPGKKGADVSELKCLPAVFYIIQLAHTQKIDLNLCSIAYQIFMSLNMWVVKWVIESLILWFSPRQNQHFSGCVVLQSSNSKSNPYGKNEPEKGYGLDFWKFVASPTQVTSANKNKKQMLLAFQCGHWPGMLLLWSNLPLSFASRIISTLVGV